MKDALLPKRSQELQHQACPLKLYLTDFELEEIKEYKQVWYLGQEATKARSSKAAEPQNTKSFNFGYDTKDGFYKAIINDHLAFRFEILGVIGAGYSGQVLKCMDHKNMELVAVKVIRNKKSVNELGKAEIKILEVLRELDKNNTANIVHMKESFYFRNHLCITFELFEKDLYRAIKGSKHHGLSEKAVKNYTIDVLKCLQLLRKKRVVHGDLKPDNILLYKHGSEKRAAVCDFGGSYFMKHRGEYQPVIHTLYYISPEMLLGKRCGPATDMWSLGCTVAELHLGRRLFRGCDTADHFCCIMKVLGVPPPELLIAAPKRHNFFQSNGVPLKDTDIRQHSSTLPRQLNSKNTYFVDFIKCCLEYNPTKRITPEEALKHPWLHKKDAKPVKSAGRTRSDTTVPCTNKKPTLLRREKVPPITKPKGKKGGN
ncbi:dual specificity tyrosine-phosphorylation-regulated kinase 4-like [Echeneis naucrates]|uniref:dual specificity tyrosine-phosphorylation-regulated kinase 4-like n=1 Tax=Echeneis naucrates TaxID=173247 RepID=UPI001114229C|nr:dual specificity tyrosine-phosphorylation-regulated kinase 4-like [Echeneis naucrates]